MSLLKQFLFYTNNVTAKETPSNFEKILENVFKNSNLLALIILIFIISILIILYLTIRSRRLNEYGSIWVHSNRESYKSSKKSTFIEITFPETESKKIKYLKINCKDSYIPSDGQVIKVNTKSSETFSDCNLVYSSSVETYIPYGEYVISDEENSKIVEYSKSNSDDEKSTIIPNCKVLQVYKTTPHIKIEFQNMVGQFMNMNCTAIQLYNDPETINTASSSIQYNPGLEKYCAGANS